MNKKASESPKKCGSALVVGGGIGGMQAALDLAAGGIKVYLVENKPAIGGVMSQLDKTFPTNDCAMCTQAPRLVEISRHKDIDIISLADIESIWGEPGNFSVTLKKRPRFVDQEKCTGCGACFPDCPVVLKNEFNLGLSERKAIYTLFPQAVPNKAAIDKREDRPCKAACMDRCPVHTNVLGYVRLIAEGRFQEAYQMNRNVNPLPSVCGRVCYAPCEEACNRGQLDEPIAIRQLKMFVADQINIDELPLPHITRMDKKVAVIGGGPAGLAAANDLALEGHQVTIFEAQAEPGGMLRYAIPEYRLPKDILAKEINYIRRLGVEIRTGVRAGKDLSIRDIRNDYQAVFIGVGAAEGAHLEIEGAGLPGVMDGIRFLQTVNLGENVEIGENVAVIGGGNTAIDCARTAKRLGAKEVRVVYRRSLAEMPAAEEEIRALEKEGVIIDFLTLPRRFLSEDGELSGMECIRMFLGDPDASGRRRPVPVPGSEFSVSVNTVIAALGQVTQLEFLKDLGILVNYNGTIAVDPITGATNIEGIFAGGDAVTGAAYVIDAIAAGKRAARSISRYLKGSPIEIDHEQRQPQKLTEVEVESLRGRFPFKKRVEMGEVPVEERLNNFREVALGFTSQEAIAEAMRCLAGQIEGCIECRECERRCDVNAIDFDQKEEKVELNVGAVVLSPGLDFYDARVRGELGFGRWPNVVTSIQFERILSASGPFNGVINRPGDKRHPKKIAWIQCVGSRDPHNANPWCSSVCCMYATKQAIIAKEHDQDIEPTIFFMDLRAFGKDFDKYVDRAKHTYGVRYQRAMISAVREEPESGNLILRYAKEDGVVVDEIFGMVVLSIGLQPFAGAAEFAQVFGIELDKNLFPKTKTFEPVATSRPGVFVTGIFQGPKDIPETVIQGSAVAGKAMALLGEARGSEITLKELPPEKDVEGNELRIGVFVCRCGINIAKTVDVVRVVNSVKGDPCVVHAEETIYACSQDTQERMKELVREKNLNRVLVASCTPRTHEPLFQETIRDAGLNKYLFELADIREQCSWCHTGQNEAATNKAVAIVKMAIAKVKLLQPVKTDSVEVTQVALVIGGGVGGITASLALAEQGIDVHLVEKEEGLGGLAKNLCRTIDGSDVQDFLKERVSQVQSHPRITIHTGVEVSKTEGYVGNFTSHLTDGTSFEHGAVILATGGIEYEPTEYLFGQDDRIITQRELEKRLESDTEKPGKRYVMIQCVGSREEPNNYCSRICCQDAIKNAIAIKQRYRDAHVTILYRDIRTYGLKEEYYQKARDLGVFFVRYEPELKPNIESIGEMIRIKAFDYILSREIILYADYVVLSTGLRPHPTAEKVGNIYKITRNPDGYFMEAHVKLRPVDFPNEGIFVAGLAHSPKTIDETISQALAAAARAGALLFQPSLVVSGIISKHNRDLCMSCLACLRLCPFGSPFIDKDGKISHNEVKCTGCGICAGICPAKAFQVNNFRDEQILAMIDAAADAVV